jgi:hypothetical protein
MERIKILGNGIKYKKKFIVDYYYREKYKNRIYFYIFCVGGKGFIDMKEV